VLAAMVGGCMPQQPAEKAPQGPADVSMAKHISAAHGVRIGEDEAADILVVETNAQVTVRFRQDFLGWVERDCLMVLRFSGPEKTFAKPEYLSFLDQLHAYLVLTPVRSRPDVQSN
jgi:hypothetical protein